MGKQTAIRRGRWKLVLNGQLIEGAPADDAVHLSDLDNDMGEKVNLAEQHPELVASMKTAALNWRAGIEERWKKEFSPDAREAATLAPSRTDSTDS